MHKGSRLLFPWKRAAYVVGTDAAAAAAVEIVAEPGFVPIVNFIPTLLQRQRAALRTRLAVEQVDSPSRTKRWTSASKRERKRDNARLSLSLAGAAEATTRGWDETKYRG